MRISDWSSDVCSSDLGVIVLLPIEYRSSPEIYCCAMAASPKNIGPKTYGLSCGNQPLCRIMFHILKYSPGNPPTIMGLVPPSPAANRRHADRDCQCDPEGHAAHPARDRPRRPQAGQIGRAHV